MIALELLHSVHDLDGASQLDAEALDQGFVAEQEQRYPVHLLRLEQVHVRRTVTGGLEVLDHLCHGPLADIRGETCIVKQEPVEPPVKGSPRRELLRTLLWCPSSRDRPSTD